MKKVICSWSGGKDSALALYEVMEKKRYDVSAILTTVTEDYGRISMHGVREVLLEEQALSIGLLLKKVFIKKGESDREYESKMKTILKDHARDTGTTGVVFGDIFLEGLRRYREKKLSILHLKGIFPIWKCKTALLARRFIGLGFKAIVTCVDSKFLPKSFAGRIFDMDFLAELPQDVDPCGENGEFHTFVYNGPIFKKKIDFTIGEVVLRDKRFYYCDLLPAGTREA